VIRLFGAVLTAFLVLWNARASANDYAVSYAFEDHDLRDAARAVCDVAPACELSLDKWNLVVRLVFFDPTHQRVNISVHEKHGQSGCCYLADGAEWVNRDVDSPISLYVYPGHAQPGDEHVPNAPIGILHLLLADVPKVLPKIEPHYLKRF
jgi:hypothetical protein